MTWRYENFGTADLLCIAGTTLADLTSTQSATGTAFYQTTREKCFNLPATDEIWIKFDVYFDGSNRWRAYNDTQGGGGLLNGISAQQTNSTTGVLSFFAESNSSIYQSENVTKKNQLQTVLLHMVSDNSAGVVEAWVDGTKIYRYTGDVNHGEDFADFYLQSDGSGTFFSNVIISNDTVSGEETAGAHLPRATTTFDLEMRFVNRSEVGFWRYENPGSGDYIYYHDNITTEAVGYDKSITGVAFWGGDNNDMFNTPAGLKEVWMRFDVWLDNGGIYNGVITCGHYSTEQGRIIGLTRATGRPTEIGIPAEGGIALYLPTKTRASLLLYMLSDASNGIIQATCAGNTHTYTGNVNDGADFNSLVAWTDSYNNTIRISNIVVSNAPLTLEDGWHREPVAVEMNIKAPDLCVRKNGTTYTVPFATTQAPPANSVVARLGGQMIYNPLVATDNANASVIKTRYNGNNRALSASFS